MAQKEASCAIAKTAAVLSDPWTILITRDLIKGPRHFCELERSLEGISTRTLTLKLKKLEAQRMVRKLTSGAYSVTSRGKGLRTIQRAMERYGEKFL